MEDRTDETAPGRAPDQPTDARQAPKFGEYAPEGWSWTPDTASSSEAPERAGAMTPGTAAAAGTASAATATATGSAPGSGRVPGVPHNLGARGSDAPPAAPTQPTSPAAPTGSHSQSAGPGQAAPDQHYRAQPPQPSPQQFPQRAAGGGRTADRVITIILLVLGALGALYFATSLQQLPSSLSLLADAFGVEGFVVPDSISTLGTVGALVVFALYAISLIYSIQRLRRGKITFWVPLVTAIIAFIVVFSFTAFAMFQTPEIANGLSDPEALTKMLDYLSQIETGTP